MSKTFDVGGQSSSRLLGHVRWVLCLLAVLGATQSGVAGEAPLGSAPTIIKLGDEKLAIPLTSFIGCGSRPNVVELRVVADLHELQAKLPGYLRAKSMRKDECGDNFELFDLSLTPDPPGASLQGQARYEKWYCTYADVPEFHGLEVRMKTIRTSKNKLVSQSGRAWTSLGARVSGDAVRFVAEDSGVRLNGLGDNLVALFGLGDDLRDLLEVTLDDVLSNDSAKLVMPDGLRNLGIELTGARFVALPDGQLGLETTAEATPSFSLLQVIIITYCAP